MTTHRRIAVAGTAGYANLLPSLGSVKAAFEIVVIDREGLHRASLSGRNPPAGVGAEAEIYRDRFSPEENALRDTTWRVLTERFLQKYIPEQATVIDVGAGDSHFLVHVAAQRKVAVDLSIHALGLAERVSAIELLQVSATHMARYLNPCADVVFMSNFLEHLPDKRSVLEVLGQAHHVLKPGGRLLLLQPNIRYVGAAYWDYIDHQIALTEHSLQEALELAGFHIETMIPRFMPYTAKSTMGTIGKKVNTEWLIRCYLRVPLLWRFFGGQTFVSARKGRDRKGV